MKPVPFRLYLPLLTPVCINAPWIMLDGVLTHLIQMKLHGRRYYYLPTKQVVKFNGPHRYQRALFFGHNGIPHASASIFEGDVKLQSMQYYKRLEVEGFPGKRKISQGTGHFRAWALRAVYVPAQAVTFYGCGDLRLIRELLELLTHLGNDTRMGWGLIDKKRMVLEPIPEDRSVVWQGKAMRPIPIRFLNSCSDAVYLPWRSPYWAAENVEMCAPPGAEVELA